MSNSREETAPYQLIDFLGSLPPGVVASHIYPHLSMGDINRTSLVSRSWSRLFSVHCQWERLIERDFNIAIGTLYEFRRRVLEIEPDMTGFFQAIYQHLRTLMRVRLDTQFTVENYFLHPVNHMALLACCANIHRGHRILREIIPLDEAEAWMWVSLYANAEASVEYFLSHDASCLGLSVVGKSILDKTASMGSLDMLIRLLNQKKYHLRVDSRIFLSAARSGNVRLNQYLCRKFPGIEKPNFRDLQDCAAESGSLEMLQLVTLPKSTINDYLTPATLKRALASGSLELVNHLFLNSNIPAITSRVRIESVEYIPAHRFNNDVFNFMIQHEAIFKLEPSLKTLDKAVRAGNVSLVKHLLQAYADLDIAVEEETLYYAALSGSLEMIQFLLDPANNFGLLPTIDILNNAIIAGNLNVVMLLLNPAHGYGIRPDIDSLYVAASYGRLGILYFLLDPENEFNLAFSVRDDIEDLLENIPSIVEPIMNCSKKLSDFFHFLSENDQATALSHLHDEEATSSLRYFFKVMIHAIMYPDHYPLDVIGTEPLYAVLTATLGNVQTMVEREQITQMLMNSSVRRLQELARAFNQVAVVEPEVKRLKLGN